MAGNAYQRVTCSGCGRTYTCTPDDDYFNDEDATGTDGVCFGCLLKQGGMNPATTPVLVLGQDLKEIDPRDERLRRPQ